MKDTGKAIFNLQRFQILQTKLNPATKNFISNDYVYAWYKRLYPLQEDNDIHEDLREYFSISKEQIEEIVTYADAEWLEKRYYTFYEYEDHYQVRTNPLFGIARHTLIAVFRYMFLNNSFDDKFWNKLLEPMKHPAEAAGISRDFNINEIYLV